MAFTSGLSPTYKILSIFFTVSIFWTSLIYGSEIPFYLNSEMPPIVDDWRPLNSYRDFYEQDFERSLVWRKFRHDVGYQILIDIIPLHNGQTSYFVQINHNLNLLEGHAAITLYRIQDSKLEIDQSIGIYSVNERDGLLASFGPQLSNEVAENTDEASLEETEGYRKNLKLYFGDVPSILKNQFLMNKGSSVLAFKVSQNDYDSILVKLNDSFHRQKKELTQIYFNNDFQSDWRKLFGSLCEIKDFPCRDLDVTSGDLELYEKFPSHYIKANLLIFNPNTSFHQNFEFLEKLGPASLKESTLQLRTNDKLIKNNENESSKVVEVIFEEGRKLELFDKSIEKLNVIKYQGELKNNSPHGTGYLEVGDMFTMGGVTQMETLKYLGGFQDGLPQGKGSLFSLLNNKKIFEGEFKNGLKNGFGISFINGEGFYGFTYKDGKVSDGEYYSRNRDSIEKGKIVAGKKEGKKMPLPGLTKTIRGKRRVIGEKAIEVFDNGGVLIGSFGFPSNYEEITSGNQMNLHSHPIWFGKCKFLDSKGGALEGTCDSNTGLVKKGSAKYTNASGQPQTVSVKEDGSYSFTTWWEEEVEIEKAGFLTKAYNRIKNEVKRIPKNLKKNNLVRGAIAVISLGYSEYALGGIKDLWIKVAEKSVGEMCEIAEVMGTEKKNCYAGLGAGGDSNGNSFLMDGDGNIALKQEKDYLNINSENFDWNSAIKYSRKQELLEFLQLENSLNWYLENGPLENKDDFLALKTFSNNLLDSADNIATGSYLSESRLEIAKDLVLLAEKIRAAGIGKVSKDDLLKYVEEFFEKNSNFRNISSAMVAGPMIGSLILPGPGTLVGALIGAGLTIWSIDQIYNAFNIVYREDSEDVSDSKSVPEKAKETLEHIKETGNPPHGVKGGKTFENNDGKLPKGRYKEYDVNPKIEGVDRGKERIVRDVDSGKTWFTPDHYETFIPMD